MKNDLKENLGQHFFVGFKGYSLSKETIKFFENVKPGGIVFFECNIKEKKQVKSLIKEINSLFEIKPFIAVDQEGGSVERLRNICTSVPSPWGLSKLGLDAILKAQKIIIEELLELGFNMNFCPILDINTNYSNPIIGTRAISDRANIVSEYGSKIIELYIKNNIIPVAKHFPGHGSLSIDSHLDLPTLLKSKSELYKLELLPFQKAIKSNVPAIMAGHIQLPQIEKDRTIPASISKTILKRLLQNEMGFKGLIITDELNMKGITKNYSLEEASLKALSSGADMILFNWEENSTLKVSKYLESNSLNDKSLLKQLNKSYTKIIRLKTDFLNKKKLVTSIVSSDKDHIKISLGLAEQVTHWIKKDLFFNPITKKESVEIFYPKTIKIKKEELLNTIKNLGIKKCALKNYELNPNSQLIQAIVAKSRTNTRKIFITFNTLSNPKQKSLLNKLLEKDLNLIVIATCLESIEISPKIKNFIAAYSPNYISLLSAVRNLLF